MTLSRTIVLLLAVVGLGLVLSACGGGSSSGKNYVAGPIACGGFGTTSYKYTAHLSEEVGALTGTPGTGAARPQTPLKVTWDAQASVEAGTSLNDYAIDLLLNNAIGSTTGRVETIRLHTGEGYVDIGQGWRKANPAKPLAVLHQPGLICSALSPDLDTTKLPPPTSETINGVPSLKFTFQDVPSTFLTRDGDFGGGSDAAHYIKTVSGSIWVAEKGDLLTKIDISGAGAYPSGQSISVGMQFELKDVGSSVSIVAPI